MARHYLFPAVKLLKQKCFPSLSGMKSCQNFSSMQVDETEGANFKRFAQHWWDYDGECCVISHYLSRYCFLFTCTCLNIVWILSHKARQVILKVFLILFTVVYIFKRLYTLKISSFVHCFCGTLT